LTESKGTEEGSLFISTINGICSVLSFEIVLLFSYSIADIPFKALIIYFYDNEEISEGLSIFSMIILCTANDGLGKFL
jgi:hypothetical protein